MSTVVNAARSRTPATDDQAPEGEDVSMTLYTASSISVQTTRYTFLAGLIAEEALIAIAISHGVRVVFDQVFY